MGKKIESIHVIDAEKRRVPSKHYVYVILVTWSDGSKVTVYRRYSRFFDLQARLLDHFPIEAGAVDPEKRVIPFLPGKIFFGRSQIKDVAMKRLKEINEYCQNLISLPPHISECDDVLEFFEVELDDLEPPKGNTDEGKQKQSLSLSLSSLSKLKSSKEKKAEKISTPKRLDCYVAIAEYVVQAPGEIALKPGLKVEVLEKSDSGWWFVNSEDEQGWVPSTYLEREGGSHPQEKQGPVAGPGQEEMCICIEKFEAAGTDEVSLEKGAVVQVLQKNMDGWWLIRYKGREAYAPGTYLKKTSSMHTISMVEQSRLSGVQIISSLHDVSNLMKQDVKAGKEQTKQNNDEPKALSDQPKSRKPSAVVKQRSLERGGSLIPPPRQNSIKKIDAPLSACKATVYVTAEDFNDTVGDGLSFKKGEKVMVSEKTTTGWWFVKIGINEGWVPSAYLEPFTEHQGVNDNYYEDDDSEWYVEAQDVEDIMKDITSSDHPAKRPLPSLPPDEEKLEPKLTKSADRPLPSAPADRLPSLPPKISTASQKQASVKPPDINKKLFSELPQTQISTGAPKVGGQQDFAAALKAKFEARSGASGDSRSASDEDSSKASKPNIPKPLVIPKPPVPNTKTAALVPNKPSDPRGSREHSPQSSSGLGGTKSVSKPPPPAKVKPVTPLKPIDPPDTHVLKPAKLPVPQKFQSKSNMDDVDKGTGSSDKVGIKNKIAAFGNSQTVKPELGEKPKPVKPNIPSKSKPAVLSKFSVPDKHLPAKEKSSQNVNSLANSLSAKLNFGQNHNPSKGSPSESMKITASLPTVTPKPTAAVTGSPSTGNSYIAIFNFVAENDRELGFNEGDEVEVLEQQGDWSLIRCWDEEGWAPTEYLQKL